MVIREEDLAETFDRQGAAEFIHVSIYTLDRLIAAQAIDTLRVGSGKGRPRFTKRALMDYLNRNVTPAAKQKRAS